MNPKIEKKKNDDAFGRLYNNCDDDDDKDDNDERQRCRDWVIILYLQSRRQGLAN